MPAVTLDFDIGTLIDSDPAHLAGRRYLKGTRVSVQQIGVLHKQGHSPAEIAYEKSLDLHLVHAALCFYHLHEGAIDRDLEEQDEEYFRLAEEHARTTSRR